MLQKQFWAGIILALISIILSEKIECQWGAEILCGDKCVSYYNWCLCGNDTMGFTDAPNYLCCHEESCFKELDGNVKCSDGVKQDWRVPCNGMCKQYSYGGYRTIPCKDGKQCVKAITLCKGVPICNE